jgi:hypothetical protein
MRGEEEKRGEEEEEERRKVPRHVVSGSFLWAWTVCE